MMVTIRKQYYPDRKMDGYVLVCDCGWWRAPVWSHMDAICDAGHHELRHVAGHFPDPPPRPEPVKRRECCPHCGEALQGDRCPYCRCRFYQEVAR
jgi:hypothetical protein